MCRSPSWIPGKRRCRISSWSSIRVTGGLDLEIFDDRVCEQSLAHLASGFLCRGAIIRVDFDDDVPADVHVMNCREAERVEGAGDGLALRIENSASRRDMDGNSKAAHSEGPVGVSGSLGP